MTQDLSGQVPESLKTVRARPLFTMRLEVRGPLVIGPTPSLTRRVGIVTGGRFEGERLSGKVLDGGSDWQTVRTDGATTLDVRLLLETNDGALIGMSYHGLRHGSPEVIRTMEGGGAVDPASYYFRTHCEFETAASQYDWLNRIIAIGLGHRDAKGPLYNVFELL